MLLCSLASSENDRLLIKYTASKSMGLSGKKAKKLYGFSDFHQQEDLILDAIEEARKIKKCIMQLAQAECTSSQQALGILVPDDLDTGESNSSISDDDSVGNALDEHLENDEVVSMHNENEKSGSTDCGTVNSTCSSSPQNTNQSNSGSVDCDMIKTWFLVRV